jgi:signal transduction histidine kinase
VTLSCLLLTRRAAIALCSLAYLLLAALVLGEWLEIIPCRQPIGAIAGTGPLDGRYAFTVLAVYGTLFGLVSFLLLGLAAMLREGERRLYDANVRLGRLSDLRRNFLQVTLHNLQSPIGAVAMFLKNMRGELGGPVTERQKEWIDRSLQRLDGLADFLHDLQIVSRLEAGDIDAQMTEVDLAGMLRGIVEEYRPLASEHGHDVVLKLPRTLPPARGIERLLREAVINFVTNAIKYTPEGGRIVVRAAGHDGTVRVEVEDNGIGVAPMDRERLFHDFVRLKRSDTPSSGAVGSGLGLSIVRRIIETHGGRVTVRSTVGRGSTFGIELPVAEGTNGRSDEATKRRSDEGEEA